MLFYLRLLKLGFALFVPDIVIKIIKAANTLNAKRFDIMPICTSRPSSQPFQQNPLGLLVFHNHSFFSR